MRWRSAALPTAIAAAIAAVAYVRWHRATAPDAQPTTTSRGRARLAELRRQPPGSIAGTVTAAGAPVSGATVCVRPGRDTARPVCVATDARGAYTINDLPPAAYVVWASAPRLAGGPWRGPAPTFDDRLWLAAGERRTGVDLVLLAGATLVRGVVSDVRGHAIAGALIHVGADSRSPPVYTTRTGADGRFVAWAMPGEIHVVASAEHYVDGEAHATVPTDQLAIELTPEAVLGGIVVEAGTRRPLADATVDVN
ncbi:MAG TPA: carboxypeptidase regulatory-like domain-containing protein, partial [Kofleriaceae bacterium]|nr:carboxypeptidase regulatory-like domain-containing protein [Kofleriaceae bacterium]